MAVALLPLGAEPRCAPVPAGLSAWFTFDEPMFAPRKENRPQRVAGLVGSALQFNGKDEYFEMPASTPGVDMGEENFTIELWVRTTDANRLAPSLVDKRDQGPLGYLIFLYAGQPGFQVPDQDHHAVLAQSLNIADNRWHHLACVAQRLPPQPLGIYVDGVKQPNTSTRHPSLASLDVPVPLWLGRHHGNKTVSREDIYFAGAIDELTFYRRALTAKEIQSIFLAGAQGKCRAR